MAIYKEIVAVLVVVVAVVCLLTGVRTEPDIRPIGYDCFGQLNPLSVNQDAVQAAVDRLIDNTADRGFNFYTMARRGGNRCYGHALCSRVIPREVDCMTCLFVTDNVLKYTCGFPGMAWLALRDCALRWQFERFED